MPRCLEIGPGKRRIPGFETLNAIPTGCTDHVGDARKLPFEDATFDLIYASHIIEHIPWYEADQVLSEWARVLKPGGKLEVWTVNAYKVAQALIDYEETGEWVRQDKWHRHGVDKDPYRWCAGRIFAYGKDGNGGELNWHKALFTPKHLQACFERAGLQDIRLMDRMEVRGKDHGWINLGVKGARP